MNQIIHIGCFEQFANSEKSILLNSYQFEFHNDANSIFSIQDKMHVALIRSKTKVDLEFLNKFRNLKLIISCTSGFDHINLDETQSRKITVMHTPKSHITSASELTWSLILGSIKNLKSHQSEIQSGNWRLESLRSHTLAGKNIGILGLGRIGKRVAQIGLAYNMKVHFYDPYIQNPSSEYIQLQSFEDLLVKSDVLTCHVPASSITNHMIQRKHFALMKPGSVFINTSRGNLFQSHDLNWALQHGILSAVGLDVHEVEPMSLKDCLFIDDNRVLLTPHVGAHTFEALNNSSQEALSKITDFFFHQKTTDSLPPLDAWYTKSKN